MDINKQALEKVAQDLSKEIGTGTTLGLGSGSTVAALIEELSPLLMSESKRVNGVPTSSQIEMVALRNGFNLVPFKGSVDLIVDGADQVDADLNLVKGGGGALLREKIVMSSAKKITVVASEEKFSTRLCQKGVRVPVEVVPMARESAKAKLSMLGGIPEERLLPKGYPYFTENGNLVFDTMFEPIENPRAFEVRLKAVPGVVEVGIFTFKPITVYKLKGDGSFEVIDKRE